MYKNMDSIKNQQKLKLINEIRDYLFMPVKEFAKYQTLITPGTLRNIIYGKNIRGISLTKLEQLRDIAKDLLEQKNGK